MEFKLVFYFVKLQDRNHTTCVKVDNSDIYFQCSAVASIMQYSCLLLKENNCRLTHNCISISESHKHSAMRLHCILLQSSKLYFLFCIVNLFLIIINGQVM